MLKPCFATCEANAIPPTCGRYGWHTTKRCPQPGRGPAGHTDSMTNGKGDNATTFTATVEATGYTAGQQIEVIVEAAHTDADGDHHAATALISGADGAQLDAAALRRLAAVCMDAADRLDAEQQRAL